MGPIPCLLSYGSSSGSLIINWSFGSTGYICYISDRTFGMETIGKNKSRLNYSYTWRESFTQRQSTLYLRENKALVPLGCTTATTEDIVDRFVNHRCTQDIDRYLSRNLQINSFLQWAQIDELRAIPDSIVSSSLILLDERNNESATRKNPTGNYRVIPNPIRAPRLYELLSRLRLPSIQPPSGQIAIGGGTQPTPDTDAERRLIYITDLDPHCVLALAATIPETQAAFLRDFIHLYLSFRALLGVKIWSPSPVGYSTFALEFHLPYYGWRRTQSMERDQRKRADGDPLRRSEEVLYLRMNKKYPVTPQELREFVYEAQVSLMITGLDEWVWTGYCFVDVYFKGAHHSEHVDHYHTPAVPLDPHSCGRNPVDPPMWNPREYFLRALSARMEQVGQEWRNTVSQLIQQIEPYTYSFTREDTQIGQASELNITQQKGFKWTIRVLRQFDHLLAKTITAWETFKSGDIRYFYTPLSDDLAEVSWSTYLQAIEKDFTELKDLRSSLQYETELFETMTNSLATHAQYAEAIVAREQSRFIQALTIITIFYLPPTLASTVFSMSVLPDSTNFRDWIYTLVTLSIVTAILVFNIPPLTSLIQKLPDRLKQWRNHNFPVWEAVKQLWTGKVSAGNVHQEGQDGGEDGESSDEEEGIELGSLGRQPLTGVSII